MNGLLAHLPVLPIVIPLVTGAVLLLLPESLRSVRVTLALTSMLSQLAVAAGLLYLTTDAAPYVWTEGVGVYLVGGWPAPFGIVLVVDRLSAMMVTLSATVASAAFVYSIAHWDRPGQPFHSLLQFLMMGLNGAFLTSDLFNLFVFFEVLLASSYGLVLRGVGTNRVRIGLHYIAVNLAGSFLFLIGVAMIYGMAGTLNMADLSGQVAALAPAERALFNTGAALLGVAFLVKAGSWPLNSWLAGTYSVAIAPVAASFAMMTKLGIYAVLRVGTLMSQDEAAASMPGFILFYLGLATMVSGTIGMLATQHLSRLVGYSVIVSTGTLLAFIGLGIEALTAPVLFYLLTSVLTTGAFFLLTGMTDRTRRLLSAGESPEATEAARRAVIVAPQSMPSYVGFGVREPDPYGTDDEVGAAIPAGMAFLGLMFVCCVLLVTGLPPLPGFVAKFTLLSTALATSPAVGASSAAYTLAAAVLLTGFAGVIALSRMGIRLFWTAAERMTPQVRVIEAVPVAFLVMLCIVLSAASGPVMNFLEATAGSMHDPQTYIRAVLFAQTGGVEPGAGEP